MDFKIKMKMNGKEAAWTFPRGDILGFKKITFMDKTRYLIVHLTPWTPKGVNDFSFTENMVTVSDMETGWAVHTFNLDAIDFSVLEMLDYAENFLGQRLEALGEEKLLEILNKESINRLPDTELQESLFS